MAITDRYRVLWNTRGVPPVLLVGALARLPVSMYALAILLLVVDQTGSLSQAGVTTGAAAIGYAATGPVLGRLADRLGPRRPLVTTAVVNVGVFAGLITAVHARVPLSVIAGCALLAGASLPPVAACQRALWRRLLADRPDTVDTAMAVDSFQLDVFLILGPLVITGLATLASPTLAVAVAAGLLLTGALGFAALPACRAIHRGGGVRTGRTSILGPLRSPGFLLLATTIGVAGMALGMMRIALIGFSAQLGHHRDLRRQRAGYGRGRLARRPRHLAWRHHRGGHGSRRRSRADQVAATTTAWGGRGCGRMTHHAAPVPREPSLGRQPHSRHAAWLPRARSTRREVHPPWPRSR